MVAWNQQNSQEQCLYHKYGVIRMTFSLKNETLVNWMLRTSYSRSRIHQWGGDERGGVIRLVQLNVANVYFDPGEYTHPMRNGRIARCLWMIATKPGLVLALFLHMDRGSASSLLILTTRQKVICSHPYNVNRQSSFRNL